MTHAVVLAIAAAMSTYTVVDRSYLFPNFHGAAVNASAADQGTAVGDVSLGRDSVIIKPVSIPTRPLVSRAPIVHFIVQGDTLESIGQQFKIPWRAVLCSTPRLHLPLTVGRPVKLPPVPGVVVIVKKGDTPTGLAARHPVDLTTPLPLNGND